MQRKSGGNAKAAAAYRSGENLYCERDAEMKPYQHRATDVRESFILAPAGAAEWQLDRAQLWNHVEGHEKRRDSRTGRDIVLGLAWELDQGEQRDAVVEFANRFVDRGYVADVSIHNYGQKVREGETYTDPSNGETYSGTERIARWKQLEHPFLEAHQAVGIDMPHVKMVRDRKGEVTGYKLYQPHAHVLLSPRAWDAESQDWAAKKDPRMDHANTHMNWRYEWPKLQNKALEEAGFEVRVSCTSSTVNEDQVPQKREHLSREAYYAQRRGEEVKEAETLALNKVVNDAVRQTASANDVQGDYQDDETMRQHMAQWWLGFRESLSERATEAKARAGYYARWLGAKLRDLESDESGAPPPQGGGGIGVRKESDHTPDIEPAPPERGGYER
ncbi:MAG: MobA/MobL family protein [Pseudomonadota bacterium]